MTSTPRRAWQLSQTKCPSSQLARLGKEKEKCLSDIAFVEKKLQNQAFVAKAPAHVVEAERAKLAESKKHLEKLEESIAALG